MPFVKGKSGNPKGRPRSGHSIAEAARRKLAEAGDDGKTNLDAILETLVKECKSGNVQAAKIMFERAEGAPVQELHTFDEDSGKTWLDDLGRPLTAEEREAARMLASIKSVEKQ